jgi:hypothetical protein
MNQSIKAALTRFGSRLNRRVIHQLNAAVNYLEVGRWMAEHNYRVANRASSREQIFEQVGKKIQDRKVLYLEFGVWRGESINFWSKLLKHDASRLHGFDSFEGLPEYWTLENARGHFSTSGDLPKIADSRVKFFKGWFEETLPKYTLPPHDELVINVDCDLYSSTKTVLENLKNQIGSGTYIYFDEFSDRFHELRAFDEFIEKTGMKFQLVGATKELSHAMFQCIDEM